MLEYLCILLVLFLPSVTIVNEDKDISQSHYYSCDFYDKDDNEYGCVFV